MTVAVLEQYANDASTALDGAIDDDDTSLVVDSATGFPAAGNFRIRIDDEILKVTAVSGTTFTVVRSQEGTAAASHADDAIVTHVLTAASLEQLIADSVNAGAIADRQSAARAGRLWFPDNGLQLTRDDGSTWRGYGPLHRFHQTPLVADFAWVNQGSATAVDQGGCIFLDTPRALGDSFRILKKAAAGSTFTVTAAFRLMAGNANTKFGIILRESSSGKFVLGGIYRPATSALVERTSEKWTSATASSAAYAGEQEVMHFSGDLFWVRIEQDSSNRILSYSLDGVNWKTRHTVSKTDFCTADEVGFGINQDQSSGTQDASLLLLSWEESA